MAQGVSTERREHRNVLSYQQVVPTEQRKDVLQLQFWWLMLNKDSGTVEGF
jgi:hypothetical protein